MCGCDHSHNGTEFSQVRFHRCVSRKKKFGFKFLTFVMVWNFSPVIFLFCIVSILLVSCFVSFPVFKHFLALFDWWLVSPVPCLSFLPSFFQTVSPSLSCQFIYISSPLVFSVSPLKILLCPSFPFVFLFLLAAFTLHSVCFQISSPVKMVT